MIGREADGQRVFLCLFYAFTLDLASLYPLCAIAPRRVHVRTRPPACTPHLLDPLLGMAWHTLTCLIYI